MSYSPAPPEDRGEAGRYEIRLQGHLDDDWAVWLGGLTLVREANGETSLTGPIIDQAALHGLLRKIRESGLALISVRRLPPND